MNKQLQKYNDYIYQGKSDLDSTYLIEMQYRGMVDFYSESILRKDYIIEEIKNWILFIMEALNRRRDEEEQAQMIQRNFNFFANSKYKFYVIIALQGILKILLKQD